jgi:hypothetical protein
LINPADGVYAVEVTNEYGCVLMSNTWLINGIQEYALRCSVYPNPAMDEVSVNGMREWIGGQLVISDLFGKVVFTDNITTDNTRINLSSWAQGVYQLRLIHEDNNSTYELVKR